MTSGSNNGWPDVITVPAQQRITDTPTWTENPSTDRCPATIKLDSMNIRIFMSDVRTFNVVLSRSEYILLDDGLKILFSVLENYNQSAKRDVMALRAKFGDALAVDEWKVSRPAEVAS